MTHISQLETQSRHKTATNILITSRSFSPQADGIGEYVYNRCLQDPEQVIVLAASSSDHRNFDQKQLFPIYRWPSWSCGRSLFLGNIIKSFCNIVFTVLLATRLYFRYHYSYIEWCHGYDFPAILFLSYLLPIRFFIYLHGKDLHDIIRNPLWRSLFKLTLKRSSGIVCQNSYIRNSLRSTFRLDIPTHVINPVIRPEKFGTASSPSHLDDLRRNTRQLHNIPETAIVILSVGRLDQSESFARVIDNLPLLLTIGVDVHYIICGEGSGMIKLQSQAQRLRVYPRVHFAGYVAERELASYYAACDIFAILSIPPTVKQSSLAGDDLGTVFLEAGYFSKPVIASRLGMILDIVYHEKNGLLVNPDSGLEVLQAFKRLSLDRGLREKFGRQGKELANRKNYHRWLYSPESRYSCLLN